jgi:hypothetical protein
MRHFLLGLLATLVLPQLAPAQNGWTRLTDPANPVVAFSAPGVYHGAAWVDVNNDGLIDLFAAPNGLFLNQGGGRFAAATTSIGAIQGQAPSGCSWADLDNDGDQDLVLAQFPSAVYLNDGAGNFQDVTAQFPGLSNYAAWGCAIGDLNDDQRLDVLLVHANNFHPTTAAHLPCKLFTQNAASFSFQSVTGQAFTDVLGPYTVPYWADYDLDGDQDLFIAAGPGGRAGPDFCYRNMLRETGQAQFQRMSSEAFAAQTQDGQCYNFVDVDNDQDLDLALTNYAGAPTRFYRNQAGTFVAETTPFVRSTTNLSNCWGDFDQDGDQDVFISNDSAPPVYYRNDGGSFIARPTLAGPAGNSGLVAGDYDNDGDLDVYITGQGAAQGLYRNDAVASGRNWLNLKLSGVVSNRSAIGTRVMVKASLNGVATWQLRTVSAQNSFQGQNDLRVHFGLNQASTIDSLVVHWPSGSEQRFGALAVNRFYTLTERSGVVALATQAAKPLPFRLYPMPARDNLLVDLDAVLGSDAVHLAVHDLLGNEVQHLTTRSAHAKLDLSHCAPGAYILQVRSGQLVYNEKIIRE